MLSKSTANDNKRQPLVKPIVSAGLFLSDIFAILLSFVAAFVTAQTLKFWLKPDLYDPSLSNFTNITDIFFLWLCPIVLFLFASAGHYTQRIPWWSQVQSVLSVCLRIFFIDIFTRFAFDMSFSRTLIGFSWVYLFLFTLIGRQIIYYIARKKEIWRIPTIVIGDIETITNMLYAFGTDRYPGYNIHTVCLRDRKDKQLELGKMPQKYATITVNRETVDYASYVEENIDNFFIISLETFRGEERDELIKALTKLNARYAVVPPVSRATLFDMEPSHFFGHDIFLLHTKKAGLSKTEQFIKRTSDLIIAGTALLLISPFMLGVSLMLKLEGQGGSVFYGGHRIGKNGRKFPCWKFRSMEPDSDHLLHELLEKDPEAKAEWDEYRKLKVPDPRITTKTAHTIRKLSIDELPQLWNVVKGDMSIVGPRPILEDEIELFGDAIHDYYQMKPGITGLWQVSGRNETTFQRRIYWDSWYARNWSLWGDIVIMIKTLRVVTGKDGAY